MIKINYFFLYLAFLTATVFAQINSEQFDPVTIPNSEKRIIQSVIVNQQYNLFIHLPAGYNKSDTKYPVLSLK